MKRSKHIVIGMTATLALAVAGCSDSEPTHNAVCIDPETEVRVDDDQCDDDRVRAGSFIWFYYPVHTAAPPVGSRINVTHGTYTKPAGTIGTVPKSGGFGIKSGTAGG